jgi:hypothetical protein
MLGARNSGLGRKATAEISTENFDVRFVEIDVEREKFVQNAAATIARELSNSTFSSTTPALWTGQMGLPESKLSLRLDSKLSC